MKDKKKYVYLCEVCKKPMPDYEPEFCCRGGIEQACGCMGLPINPQICSQECMDVCMKRTK